MPTYIPKGNACICSPKKYGQNIHGSPIHNSQEVETIQMSNVHQQNSSVYTQRNTIQQWV